MGSYVLWCLNRIARWDPEPLREALAAGGHSVRYGDRGGWNLPHATEPLYALMYEGEPSEYFVPIPVKCLGDPGRFEAHFLHRMTPDGRERYQGFKRAYSEHFPASPAPPPAPGQAQARTCEWPEYWKDDLVMRMHTRDHAGLYEVMHSQKAEGKAVLVGYSQGGLVAHFLAWMDEFFFPESERCVAGVVTVQSPNRGSPLANRLNEPTVSHGIFSALAAAAGYPATRYAGLDDALAKLATGALETPREGVAPWQSPPPSTSKTEPPGAGHRHFDVDAVVALLTAILTTPPESEVVATARKWLSGLTPPTPSTAFQDLSTLELDRAGSVLNLLATRPLERTLHGAVVGIDSSTDDLVMQALPWPARVGVRLMPGLSGLRERLDLVKRVYQEVILNERPLPARGRWKELVDDYWRDTHVQAPDGSPVPVPKCAHDFVIPSVSQVLGPRAPAPVDPGQAPPGFLGVLVNPKGSHLSGAEAEGSASDVEPVKTLLRELASRLP